MNERLVMRSKKSMTAIMITNSGYKLTRVDVSVWLEHSSFPLKTFWWQEHVAVSKYCPYLQVCLYLQVHWHVSESQIWRVLLTHSSFSRVSPGRHWHLHVSDRKICRLLQEAWLRLHSHLHGPLWCSSSMLVQYGVLFT